MAKFNLANVAIFGFIIFFILFIVFLFLYIDSKNNRVAPENCPKVLSTYSVVPNVNSGALKPLYICTQNPTGAAGTSQCNFNGITSVESAIGICNLYGSKCNGFSYNPSDGSLILINANYTFITDTKTSNLNGDVYLRQTNM
jgi:hypothetical protein